MTTGRIKRVSIDRKVRDFPGPKADFPVKPTNRIRNEVSHREHGGFDQHNSERGGYHNRSSENHVVLRDRKAVDSSRGNNHRNEGRSRSPRNRGQQRFSPEPARERRPLENEPESKSIWEVNPQVACGGNIFENALAACPPSSMQIPINPFGFTGRESQQAAYYVVLPSETLPVPLNQFQAPQPVIPLEVMNSGNMSVQGSSESRLMETQVSNMAEARHENLNIQSQHFRCRSPERADASMSTNRADRISSRPIYRGTSPVGEDAILRVPYCRACKEYIGREKDLGDHLKSEKHFNNYHFPTEERDSGSGMQDHRASESFNVGPISESHYQGRSNSGGNGRSFATGGGEIDHRRERYVEHVDRDRDFDRGQPSGFSPEHHRYPEPRGGASSPRRSRWEESSQVGGGYSHPEQYGAPSQKGTEKPIVFNPPKIMGKDWGKAGNRRGDYGQAFADTYRRDYSTMFDVSKCHICGLKGNYDMKNHLRMAHGNSR